MIRVGNIPINPLLCYSNEMKLLGGHKKIQANTRLIYEFEHCDSSSEADHAFVCQKTAAALAFLNNETINQSPFDLDLTIDQYKETGEVINPQALMQYWQQRQPLGIVNSEGVRGEASTSLEQGLAASDAFAKAVEKHMEARNPQELRLALEKELEGVFYNKDAAAGFDPLISGRLNCNSGTFLYLSIAAKLLPPEELNQLVMIYTNGHVTPGYQTEVSGETVYEALEMSANVLFPQQFSERSISVTGPFKVVKAFGAMLENTTNNSLRADTVLLDKSKNNGFSPVNLIDPETFSSFNTNQKTHLPHLHGFGKVEVPAGDIDRIKIDYFHYNQAFSQPGSNHFKELELMRLLGYGAESE